MTTQPQAPIIVIGRSMFSDEIVATETFFDRDAAAMWARRMNDADCDGISYNIVEGDDDDA